VKCKQARIRIIYFLQTNIISGLLNEIFSRTNRSEIPYSFNCKEVYHFKITGVHIKHIILFSLFVFSGIGYTQNFWQQNFVFPERNWNYSFAINIINGEIMAASYAGIYCSTNNGNSWYKTGDYSCFTISFNSDGSIFAGTTNGLFYSSDNGINWETTDLSGWDCPINAIVTNSAGYIFAGGDDGWLYRSTDKGQKWGQLKIGTISSLAANSKGHIFAGSYNGVFRSTDNGSNWDQLNASVSNIHIVKIDTGGQIYVGGYDGGLLRSTDNGDSWIQLLPKSAAGIINDVAINSAGVIFTGADSGAFRSTDNGVNWDKINGGLNSLAVNSLLTTPGGYVFAGAGNGIYISTMYTTPVELNSFTSVTEGNNAALSWNTATELNNRGFELERKTSEGSFKTIAFIRGNGTSSEAKKFTYTDKNLRKGKYSYRLKQLDFNGTSRMYNSINVEINESYKFILGQNYPNPFNPSTVISYSLPEPGNVTLIIYDILGNEITTLVNGNKPAGQYSAYFNADKLSSGIYLCTLRAGNFVDTKKMLLLK